MRHPRLCGSIPLPDACMTPSPVSHFYVALQRIVRLGGAVDDDNSNLLVAQLLYLDSIGKKDITMYVNSPGGSVTAGMHADILTCSIYAVCHTKCKLALTSTCCLFEAKVCLNTVLPAT